MAPREENSLLLIAEISGVHLYKSLVLQIKKDFEMIGQAIAISEFMPPEIVVKELQLQVHHLLQHNFNAYLQLLYRVDVPEHLIGFTGQDSRHIAERAVFFILKREYEKVQGRANFTKE